MPHPSPRFRPFQMPSQSRKICPGKATWQQHQWCGPAIQRVHIQNPRTRTLVPYVLDPLCLATLNTGILFVAHSL
eukprot:364446-Chlamydomonas_euryale.AAC.10